MSPVDNIRNLLNATQRDPDISLQNELRKALYEYEPFRKIGERLVLGVFTSVRSAVNVEAVADLWDAINAAEKEASR